MVCSSERTRSMSEAMQELWFRFYGRFVIAHPEEDKKNVYAIAVELAPGATDPSEQHQCLMTILERNVLEASFVAENRTVGPDLVPYEGARLLWNIKDCKVDVTTKS